MMAYTTLKVPVCAEAAVRIINGASILIFVKLFFIPYGNYSICNRRVRVRVRANLNVICLGIVHPIRQLFDL